MTYICSYLLVYNLSSKLRCKKLYDICMSILCVINYYCPFGLLLVVMIWLANLILFIITWRFLLEAKAVWEHTCIAGGLFLLPIKKTAGKTILPAEMVSFYFTL